MTETIIDASWDESDRRYFVDPSHTDCDCAGQYASGWISEDGNDWTDAMGGDVLGDFERVTIRLIGGPRDGEMVS